MAIVMPSATDDNGTGTTGTILDLAKWTALGTAIDAADAAVKVSPALTGVPTAPTAAPGTNTTQIATTAFSAAAVTAAFTIAPVSWTPSDASGAALSLTNGGCSYVRISSSLVFVSFDITYPATANGSNAKIGGLPFTALAGRNSALTLGYNTQSAQLMVRSSTTTVEIYSGAGVAKTNANMTGANIIGSGLYLI